MTRIHPGAVVRTGGRRLLRAPWESPLAVAAAGIAGALVLAAASTRLSSPVLPLAFLGLVVVLAAFGPEVGICLGVLVGFGLAPFVDPVASPGARLPFWLIGFALAGGLMLVTFVGRTLARAPAARVQVSLLLWVAGALLLYTLVQLGESSPRDVPSMAAPFLVFPLGAVLTYLWLLHDDALDRLRRLLPFFVAVAAAWGVMYVLGSGAHCGPCRQWVSTYATHSGVLGGDSRLYTWGQEAFIGLVVLVAARAALRPTRLWIGLAALGVVCTLLQDSRAQDVALCAGLLILLIWRVSHMRGVTRLLVLALTGLAAYAVLSSPVGQHVLTGYQDLTQNSGTGGYRLGLIDQYRRYWSFSGVGVSYATLDMGFDLDLGVPNTILVLGYLGAALQILLLVAAIARGLVARSPLGIALAAAMVTVLFARPSLPFLETGPGSVAYGMAIGAIAALYVPGRRLRALAGEPA